MSSKGERRAFGLAYRMLGTVADAEDVVQEARLKMLEGAATPDNPEAYLFRTVANLAVDHLRREKVRRKHYPGPWLPEPVAEDASGDALVELADSLSVGLLFMLERLAPGERVVFLLREAYDFSFNDIAELLHISVPAARQRFRRAKVRLDDKPEPALLEPQQREWLDRLMLAINEQRVPDVIDMLHEDAVVYTDGGGVVSAAIIPVTGRERIAQVAVHLGAKGDPADFSYRFTNVGDRVGLVMMERGAVHSYLELELRDGLVYRAFVMRNPDKLKHLA